MKHATNGTSPAIAEAKAAIRATRSRLSVRLAETSGHVQLLFTVPSTADTEAFDGGVISGATKAIAAAGNAKRVWNDARRTGLLRRATLGGLTVAIAAALATRPRRR
jgi:hypothetical protein